MRSLVGIVVLRILRLVKIVRFGRELSNQIWENWSYPALFLVNKGRRSNRERVLDPAIC
jgi:hypothetical protein